jgi:hypothetical protein
MASHSLLYIAVAQRLLAVTLLGAPFACCLLAIPPRTWPLAVPAALFAFSAFFLLSCAVFFSLPSLIAAWRAAARVSGLCARRSLMTSKEAPTMARCDLTVRRVRFFATSCAVPRELAIVVADVFRLSSGIRSKLHFVL